MIKQKMLLELTGPVAFEGQMPGHERAKFRPDPLDKKKWKKEGQVKPCLVGCWMLLADGYNSRNSWDFLCCVRFWHGLTWSFIGKPPHFPCNSHEVPIMCVKLIFVKIEVEAESWRWLNFWILKSLLKAAEIENLIWSWGSTGSCGSGANSSPQSTPQKERCPQR